jgi:hypothetical protein
MTRERLERALLDPTSVFAAPEDVLTEPAFNADEKVRVLLEWHYNASEEAVALEEGMPGEENDELRRILFALGKIVGPIDIDHTGPTKQRGLSRSQHFVEFTRSLRRRHALSFRSRSGILPAPANDAERFDICKPPSFAELLGGFVLLNIGDGATASP